MRVFIALVLPELFKTELIARTRVLREGAYPLRWTPADNLHLTLAFLGELDGAALSVATEAGRRTAARHTPFILSFRNLTVFPRRSSARILAATFSEGDQEACSLASDLEDELERLGREAGYRFREREDRRFTAHVTLARSGRQPVKLGPEALSTDSGIETSTCMETLAVFESRLHRNGTQYVRLAEFALHTPPSQETPLKA